MYSQDALQKAIEHCLEVVKGEEQGKLALIDPRKLRIVLEYLLKRIE